MKILMKEFEHGAVGKKDLAAALRAHKAAVNATKSPQRLEAEEYDRIRSHGGHALLSKQQLFMRREEFITF